MISTNKIVTRKDVVIVTNAPKITKKEVIIPKKTKERVVKTIRLRRAGLEPWIYNIQI